MNLEPLPTTTQATIEMLRSLKGPPVRRAPEGPRKALSPDTESKLIAAAAVGASEAHYPWWTLWLLPVGYKSYSDPPREMPKAESFVTPVRA